MSLKTWAFGRYVGNWAKEARVGKLGGGIKGVWDFLNGWKTPLMSLAFIAKTVWPNHWIWEYVNAALPAIGWSWNDSQLMDPAATALVLATLSTLGHSFGKAYKDWKAGVPATMLKSVPVEAIDIAKAKALAEGKK